jgi:Arc/MetJ-type ribon-helix-helix transcriptional regulator
MLKISTEAPEGDSLHVCQDCNTLDYMKTVTVRLPETLAAEIEAEARERRRSKSDVVRERLSHAVRPRPRRALTDAIADLVGSVEGLPSDLSERKKAYLGMTGYGQKRGG